MGTRQLLKKTMLATAVSALAAGIAIPSGAQSFNEWRDPELNAVNRAPMHASFFPYADKEEAAQAVRENSENYLSLNGTWKFKWVRHSYERPEGFWVPGYNDAEWDNIPVPGIWELHGYGDPIYLNIGYAWRDNFKRKTMSVHTAGPSIYRKTGPARKS